VYRIGKACHPGTKRKDRPNQDSIGTVLPHWYLPIDPLLIVADGMGGYNGGEIASRLVVQAMRTRYYRECFARDKQKMLQNGIQAAHARIRKYSGRQENLESMGSTLAALLLTPKKGYLANVGDSRIYRIRANAIEQISYDHSMVAELVRNGLINGEEALKHPQRSRLTMSISARREQIAPFFLEFPIESGDGFLLCSDGLWSVVPEALILAAVLQYPPQTAAHHLVELANRAGGPDNISVIIAAPRVKSGLEKEHPESSMEETNPGRS
jgi:protein phosphatase